MMTHSTCFVQSLLDFLRAHKSRQAFSATARPSTSEMSSLQDVSAHSGTSFSAFSADGSRHGHAMLGLDGSHLGPPMPGHHAGFQALVSGVVQSSTRNVDSGAVQSTSTCALANPVQSRASSRPSSEGGHRPRSDGFTSCMSTDMCSNLTRQDVTGASDLDLSNGGNPSRSTNTSQPSRSMDASPRSDPSAAPTSVFAGYAAEPFPPE